ncbi:hypothetical protein RN001_000461 [Aquatica leii]|uniref:Uncharacterized protein n=1 Tax=Aquatica leii TaxID=1421715 RepID=A0AAN7SSG2_9COLE|nr:hypothetical protein RN001_000461 [Aquatica leii]
MYESENEHSVFIGSVINSIETNVAWYEMITFNENKYKFKIDTGAMINIMPLKMLNDMGFDIINLQKSHAKLYAYPHNLIHVLGKIMLKCGFENHTTYSDFYVVREKHNKGNRVISFAEWEEVYVRDYRNLNKKGWVQAIIDEVLGQVVEAGICWKRHLEQIIKRKQFVDKDEDVNLELSSDRERSSELEQVMRNLVIPVTSKTMNESNPLPCLSSEKLDVKDCKN